MKNIIKELIYLLGQPVLSKILKFRNMYEGQECYLIGDGSSIKWFDLKNFKDKQSIPCGKIFYHKDFNCLNVKHITLAESFYFSPFFLMTHKKSAENYKYTKGKIILKKDPLISNIKKIIERHEEINFFVNFSNFPFLFTKKNIYYLFKNIPEFEKDLNFLTNKINSFAGSLRFTILLAIFMGFKKIYLVGFDYLFDPSCSGHWYEKNKGKVKDLGEYQKDFFEIASNFCDFTIVTIDGKSKYLPSIEYTKLTNDKLHYKENTQIISANNLKILSSSPWHSYRIY